MTPLRQKFIDELELRGLSPLTRDGYLHVRREFIAQLPGPLESLDLRPLLQAF